MLARVDALYRAMSLEMKQGGNSGAKKPFPTSRLSRSLFVLTDIESS